MCERQSFFWGQIFAVFDPKKKLERFWNLLEKNANSTNFANCFWKNSKYFRYHKNGKNEKNIGEHVLVSFYHVCLLAAFVGCAYSEGRETMKGFSFGRTVRGTFIRPEFEHLNCEFIFGELHGKCRILNSSSKLTWGEKIRMHYKTSHLYLTLLLQCTHVFLPWWKTQFHVPRVDQPFS